MKCSKEPIMTVEAIGAFRHWDGRVDPPALIAYDKCPCGKWWKSISVTDRSEIVDFRKEFEIAAIETFRLGRKKGHSLAAKGSRRS